MNRSLLDRIGHYGDREEHRQHEGGTDQRSSLEQSLGWGWLGRSRTGWRRLGPAPGGLEHQAHP